MNPKTPHQNQNIFPLKITLITYPKIIFIIILQMSRAKDITIDSIIKKYQHRKQQLQVEMNKQKSDNIDTARHRDNIAEHRSGLSTPEFNYTMERKDLMLYNASNIERTHKKEQNYQEYHSEAANNSSFYKKVDREEYELVLKKLDVTEQKLARSQRNFSQIWRKHQRMLQQKEISVKEVAQGRDQFSQARLRVLERENSNLKQCLSSKDSNINLLKQKLQERSQQLMDAEAKISSIQGQIERLLAQNSSLRSANIMQEDQKDKQMQNQAKKVQQLLKLHENEKKQLLTELERTFHNHQQQLQIVRDSYIQVQQEYRTWIEQANNEKLSLIRQYQSKLAQATLNNHEGIASSKTQRVMLEQTQRKDQEISRLISLSLKQTSQLNQLRSENQRLQSAKSELLLKISSTQNTLIDKTQSFRAFENENNRLQAQLKEQRKNGTHFREKYWQLSKELMQLKGKCKVVFQELQHTKRNNSQSLEIVRLKNELIRCRQQLQRAKSSQHSHNVKLDQVLKSMKQKLNKIQQENSESMADLMAQRLQNARLRDELKETKQFLKREYQLSLQNTRKQLEAQVRAGESKRSYADPEKQEVYLKLRGLQKRYQVLMDQIVTVDEVAGLANKVRRRHHQARP